MAASCSRNGINAAETLDRSTSLFDPHQQARIRLQLGSLLRAIVSQRLVPLADGSGRVPAVEVMVNKGQIREYIETEAKNRELGDAIARGAASYGCQTFDQSLYTLYSAPFREPLRAKVGVCGLE